MKAGRQLLGMSTLLVAVSVWAGGIVCHGRMIDLMAINWDGLFPITIGASPITSGSLPDTPNPTNPVCLCGDVLSPHIGLALGYWEPMALVDVTRTPYCLVNFNEHAAIDGVGEGDVDTATPDQHSAFYYVHYYNFPIMSLIANGLLGGSCQTDGTFLVPTYFSELDPTWKNEQLAKIVYPETATFMNPLAALGAQAACTADSLAANTGLPRDEPHWCAGSQGFMYPFTGEVAEYASGAQASTLIAERAMAKLHASLLIPDTQKNQLCDEQSVYHLPKSRYRYQMIYPAQGAIEPFGHSTAIWAQGIEKPWAGDDAGYLIWRKRNCCNY